MRPKISIVVPIHNMLNGQFFLWRLIQSLMQQTFTDYELVITQEGKMARNTNAGILKAKGELIKILYMDDYFAHTDALKNIVENFKGEWLVTGCLHQQTDGDLFEDPHSPHYPEYTVNISTGNNRIGSPSVLTIRNEGHLLFDENMSFLLDCDLYERYYKQYGAPTVLNDLNVVIGLHSGQTSNLMSNREKQKEAEYLNKKHEKTL